MLGEAKPFLEELARDLISFCRAGVIGLTTALVLSRDPRNSVLVVAEFMPGDYDIGYASCWAGANFYP